MDKKDFEDSLRIPALHLLLAGLKVKDTGYSQSVEKFCDSYMYVINILILYSVVFGEIYWVRDSVKIGRSFVEISLTAPCMTISTLSTGKVFCLILNRKTAVEIVDKLREIHPDVNNIEDNNINEEDVDNNRVREKETDFLSTLRSVEEKDIFRECKKSVAFVTNIFYYMCSSVIIAFPLMTVASMGYDYHKTGEMQYKYPYLVKYFFDINNIYAWPGMYIHQFISTLNIKEGSTANTTIHNRSGDLCEIVLFADDTSLMMILGEIMWEVEGILIGKSFIELSLNVPCMTISMLGTAKITLLYMNKPTVIKIFDKLRDIHPDIDNDDFENDRVPIDEEVEVNSQTGDLKDIEAKKRDVERRILKESVVFLELTVKLQYYMWMIVVYAFPATPVISMAYEYYKTGETEYKYPYSVQYFIDINNSWIWPLEYLHHTLATLVVGVNLIGADSFFYALCIYIQMHFRLLSRRCENIISDSTESTTVNIIKAIRRHQELVKLVDQVEQLYSKSMLVNIMTSSVLICLSGFISTMVDDYAVVVPFALFLFMSMFQIFLLCYFGDKLMQASTQVSQAIYNTPWYNTDEKIKKILLLILTRAQKPCKLTALDFADLNLTVFMTIISRSWSYFALLKTMYN